MTVPVTGGALLRRDPRLWDVTLSGLPNASGGSQVCLTPARGKFITLRESHRYFLSRSGVPGTHSLGIGRRSSSSS